MLTCRTRGFDANEWKTLTYNNARRATSYPNAMDINTGVFTAPETGTYQFIIQVSKVSNFLLLSKNITILVEINVHIISQ